MCQLFDSVHCCLTTSAFFGFLQAMILFKTDQAVRKWSCKAVPNFRTCKSSQESRHSPWIKPYHSFKHTQMLEEYFILTETTTQRSPFQMQWKILSQSRSPPTALLPWFFGIEWSTNCFNFIKRFSYREFAWVSSQNKQFWLHWQAAGNNHIVRRKLQIATISRLWKCVSWWLQLQQVQFWARLTGDSSMVSMRRFWKSTLLSMATSSNSMISYGNKVNHALNCIAPTLFPSDHSFPPKRVHIKRNNKWHKFKNQSQPISNQS